MPTARVGVHDVVVSLDERLPEMARVLSRARISPREATPESRFAERASEPARLTFGCHQVLASESLGSGEGTMRNMVA